MAWNIRSLVAITLPALGLLVGLFWFRKRKSSNSLEYPKPPDKISETKQQNSLTEKKNDGSLSGAGDNLKPAIAADVKCNAEVEDEIVAVSDISSNTPIVCEEQNVPVVEERIEAVNNNVVESSKPEEDRTTDIVAEDSFDLSISPETKKITDIGDITSHQSWAESVDEEQVVNDQKKSQVVSDAPLTDEQSTNDVDSHQCKSDVEKLIESTPTPMQHSIADSKSENSEIPTPLTLKSDTLEQNSKTAASSEVAKSQLSVTNSASSKPVCVSTEEEVSSTLNGEKSRSSSLAVSSESPNSMNSTGSSDSGSCDHDIRSEVSADSGRGGSVAEMSSPVTIPDGAQIIYEFDFPTDRCGMLIGKNGRTINRIKDLSRVEISVNRKMYTQDYQLVVLAGTQCQIDKALTLLRDRFPIDRFPDITFKPAPQEGPMLQPEMMQLSLPEGVYVDVLVSSVVAPNHVFIQQPTHPTFHMLETLNQCMNVCYAQDNIVPQLPRPIETGVICAAPMYDTGWYRSQIVQSNPDTDEVEIKFVDFGGYLSTQGCLLRQIRSDFSQLPFQAVECYLANVMPPNGAEVFPAECNALMEQMVQGKMLQAQVVGHEADGIPYIQLYDMQAEQTMFVNRELVNSGSAQWIEHLL